MKPWQPITAPLILWEGPSEIDGAPIVVIATVDSDNRKTGDMIQTWIMRRDVAPHVAVRTGEDVSICGDCPHRRQPNGTRTCYVTVHNAPRSVWAKYRRGGYKRATGWQLAAMQSMKVRAGSYGDPGAVPGHVWARILGRRHTGYTHQWRRRPDLMGLVMASVDSLEEHHDATRAGWRTFRVTPHDVLNLEAREIECLAESRGLTCATCNACHGARNEAPSIAIRAHGAAKRSVGLPIIQ